MGIRLGENLLAPGIITESAYPFGQSKGATPSSRTSEKAGRIPSNAVQNTKMN